MPHSHMCTYTCTYARSHMYHTHRHTYPLPNRLQAYFTLAHLESLLCGRARILVSPSETSHCRPLWWCGFSRWHCNLEFSTFLMKKGFLFPWHLSHGDDFNLHLGIYILCEGRLVLHMRILLQVQPLPALWMIKPLLWVTCLIILLSC